MGLIAAQGEQAANAAYHALEGSLSREIKSVSDTLVAASAHMAAWADYPDEDVEELDYGVLLKQFQSCKNKLQALCQKYDAGQAISSGVDTVIVGRPNVGKSTLMNLLLGKDRSIVTDIAGTTRDVIEETAVIGNVILHLSDTAGLHTSDDPVESIGIEMAEKRLRHADLILAVFDGNQALDGEDQRILDFCKDKPSIGIINKADLGNVVSEDKISPFVTKCITISANDPSSYDTLEHTLESILGTTDFDSSAAMLANERQLICVRKSLDCLNEAINAITGGMTMDAINVCVDAALEPLLELTGEKVSDTVIDKVFSTFCVGK